MDIRAQLTGDRPKLSLSEDEFGVRRMVESVADTLVHRVSEDGYVIGIEGSWGSGKSTFVNFVVEEIGRKSSDDHVIKFEPWLIGDSSAVLASFFGQLASKIDEIGNTNLSVWERWKRRIWKKRHSDLANKVRRYGEYVGVLAASAAGAAFLDPTGTTAIAAVGLKTAGLFSRLWKSKPLSLHELKSEIVTGIMELAKQRPNLRFAIVIDDLDRLEPEEALQML